jgi:hypothetical protein
VEAVLRRKDDEEADASNPFALTAEASLAPDDPSRPPTALPLSAEPSRWGGGNLQGGNSAPQVLVLYPPTPAPQAPATPLPEDQGPVTAQDLLAAAAAAAAAAGAGENGGSAGDARPSTGSSLQGEGTVNVLTSSIDLARGLAVHTAALLRARQAAVAGMPLGAINARLEEFALEHNWDADGSLADFSSIASSLPGSGSGKSGATSGHQQPPAQAGVGSGGSAAGAKAGAAVAGPPSVSLPPRPTSPGSHSTTTAGDGRQRDYLREAREAKELESR